MAVYEFADLWVDIEGIGTHTKIQLEPYIAVPGKRPRRPDFSIRMTPELLRQEEILEGLGFERDYLESMAVYRAFCKKALDYDVMFFHSSAIAMDGEAYLFTGHTGAGKSTHTRKWMETFPGRVILINDDKPLIRFRKDGAYVFGTPWAGKTGENMNIAVKVKAVCCLCKAQENRIRKMDYQETRKNLSEQVMRVFDWDMQQKQNRLLSQLVNQVPVYELRCTATTQAAYTAWEGMK